MTGHLLAQCGGAIAGASVMLGLFGGDNVGDLGLGEAVLGLEFLLTFMIVLAYLRVSNQDNISSGCQYNTASGD